MGPTRLESQLRALTLVKLDRSRSQAVNSLEDITSQTSTCSARISHPRYLEKPGIPRTSDPPTSPDTTPKGSQSTTVIHSPALRATISTKTTRSSNTPPTRMSRGPTTLGEMKMITETRTSTAEWMKAKSLPTSRDSTSKKLKTPMP